MFSVVFVFSIIGFGRILISDLVVANLLMYSLPGMILLYLAMPFLYQRCFWVRYNINGQPLTSVDYHKDLGVTFDCYLNFHQQTSEIALKANRVLACMKRAFVDLNCDVFLKLYKALVRPIMEYANIIWGPHFLLDKRKLERVQCRATKLIP